MRSAPRIRVALGFAFASALLVTFAPARSSAFSRPAVPLKKAVEQADFVGVVRITEVPAGKTFRASAPPVVVAKPVVAVKGDAKVDLRIVWQTFPFGGLDHDPRTVEVLPPKVGDEYMVYLAKGKDGALTRLGYQWHFHPMPAAPTMRVQPSHDGAWRGLIEVSPPVAAPGEAVRYRFTRTRLAAQGWSGTESNLTAEDIDVIDVARKRVLDRKKPGVRKSAHTLISQGESVADVIDLTAAFGITEPGEYWVFRGGAFEGNAPLRFTVSDKLRVRTDKE